MSGKSPCTRFLARVMNPHAQVDRCIVPELSEAFGEPGRVRICSKVQKTGNRQLHQGQGAQNTLQVWPMSREEPREKISRQPAARAVQPSAQTSSEATESTMNTEKTKLQLQITMLCIETHMMQVGVLGKLRWLWRILGVNARGQATNGVHLDIFYRGCPPLLVLSLDPQEGIRDPHRGPIGRLR